MRPSRTLQDVGSAVAAVAPKLKIAGTVAGSFGVYLGLFGIASRWGIYKFLGLPDEFNPLSGETLLKTVESSWGDGAEFIIDTVTAFFDSVLAYPLWTLGGFVLVGAVGFCAHKFRTRTRDLVIAAAVFLVASGYLLIAPWMFYANVLRIDATDVAALRVPHALVTANVMWQARVCAEAEDLRLYGGRSVPLDCRSSFDGAFRSRVEAIFIAIVGSTMMIALIVISAWIGRPFHLRRGHAPLRMAVWVVAAMAGLQGLATSYIYSKALKKIQYPARTVGPDTTFYLSADGALRSYNPAFEHFRTVNQQPEGLSEDDIVARRIKVLLDRPEPPALPGWISKGTP